jgi:hypothetical protein
MRITINFTDAEWVRIEEAMGREVPEVTAATIGAWLKGTMGNMVSKYETNKAYDTMRRDDQVRKDAENWSG